jgi:hypothetical protein
MHPYRKSGTIPFTGGVLASLIIVLSAVACGVANAYAIHLSPVNGVAFVFCVPIPILLIASLCCAAACGFATGFSLRLGKIRNDGFDRAACVGALIIYLWAYWSAAQAASGWAPLDWQACLPTTSFEFAEMLIARDGAQIILAWVAETVLIALMLIWLILTRTQVPFCDRCNVWTTVQNGYLLFRGQQQDEAWIRFRDGEFERLLMIPMLEEKSPAYMRLDLASCPVCGESRSLAIQAVIPSAFSDQGPIHDHFVPFQELLPSEFQTLEQLANEIEPVSSQ